MSIEQADETGDLPQNPFFGAPYIHTYISTDFPNLLVVRQHFYALGCRLSQPGVTKG